MLTDEQKKMLNVQVQRIVSDVQDQIVSGLSSGIDSNVNDPYTFASVLATNAVRLSTTISVQILIEYLEEQGLIQVANDERTLTKLSLSVIEGKNDIPPKY